MFEIAVCEDDPRQTDIILALLDKYKSERPGTDIRTATFCSGSSILQAVIGGQEFNLFLLDILLPDINGIEFASELRALQNQTPLVFLTSSSDYALDAFKVSASQYILKPIRYMQLFPVLDSIIALSKHEKERYALINTSKNTVKVAYGDIVCVELLGRTLKYYLENGDVLLSSTIRISFSDAISDLLNDSRFLCKHKSFVVNMAHVKEVGNHIFKMKSGLEVPIPRYNFASARDEYSAWLSSLG